MPDFDRSNGVHGVAYARLRRISPLLLPIVQLERLPGRDGRPAERTHAQVVSIRMRRLLGRVQRQGQVHESRDVCAGQ